MIDISEPAIPGDILKYKCGDEIKSDIITECFWDSRPKGGKEYCYRTKFGDVVPVSAVVEVVKDKSVLHHSSSSFPASESELFSSLIEQSTLPTDQKSVLLLILENDIESLGIAKAMIEKKLKSLGECLSKD